MQMSRTNLIAFLVAPIVIAAKARSNYAWSAYSTLGTPA